MDCCGVLRDHIGGLCLLSCSPHSSVKLFCGRSHCQPCSTEGLQEGKHYSLIKALELMLPVERFPDWRGRSSVTKYRNLYSGQFQPCYVFW